MESEPPSIALDNSPVELSPPGTSPAVFVASAKSPNALREYLEHYIAFCNEAAESDFYNTCYTSCVGREHYKYRVSCVASTFQDLSRQLENALKAHTNKQSPPVGRLVFGFPGK